MTSRPTSEVTLLKAFGHPTRLAILAELAKGVRCVTEMQQVLRRHQVSVSQHLAVLRQARLVDCCRHGALRCYYLARPQLVTEMLSLLSRNFPQVVRTLDEVLDEARRAAAKRPGARQAFPRRR